jgi:hypothetical protein
MGQRYAPWEHVLPYKGTRGADDKRVRDTSPVPNIQRSGISRTSCPQIGSMMAGWNFWSLQRDRSMGGGAEARTCSRCRLSCRNLTAHSVRDLSLLLTWEDKCF